MRSKRSLVIFTGLILVLLISTLIVGCASKTTTSPTTSAPPATTSTTSAPPATSAKPSTTPAATSTTAAPAIKLLFADFFPAKDWSAVTVEEWGKELEQRSGGKVKVEYSHGGALAAAPDLYDRMNDGLCDAVVFQPYALLGRFPISEIMPLPFAATMPSSQILTKSLMATYKKGYFDKEMADVKYIFGFVPPASEYFWSIPGPVATVADFKGKKLRIYGSLQTDMALALGLVPVSMATPEIDGAMRKGTVEGFQMGYATGKIFCGIEVIKSVTESNFCCPHMAFVMSKKSYDKLPKDVQAIVDDMINNKETWALKIAKRFDDDEAPAKAALVAQGTKISTISVEELTKMDALFAPMWTKAIAAAEAKNVPIKAFLADFAVALKAQGVQKPFVGYNP